MRSLEPFVHGLERRGLNRDGNKFEIYWEKNSSTSIEVKDSKVDTLTQSTDQGVALRVLKEGRMGFSYTFDLSPDSITRAIDTAIEVSKLMPVDPNHDLPNFGEYPYSVFSLHDQAGLDIPIDKKIKLSLEIEQQIKSKDKRIQRVRSAGYDETELEVTIVDSSSEKIHFEKTIFATYVTCVAEQDHASEMGSDVSYSHFFSELKTDKMISNAAHNATELLGAGKTISRNVPAVFKNSVMAQLIGFLSSSFSAENVDKNMSLLAGKIGEKFFSEKFNLIDDGSLNNGIATTPFDGEGIPQKKNTLIEDGVIRTFLYDSYYAKKLQQKSTASARRGSLKSPPSIGHSNLILKKGKYSFDSLLKDAHDGIYITQILGLHTANPITGEFSLGASGLLIENGILTKPVKGFAISGKISELFKNITHIGNDERNFGSITTPSILFKELSIGGSTS